MRLLEVKESASQPRFFEDGFTRKLTFKEHPYREAIKALLADNDRHCVDSSEQLRHTPHAMTALGLMSGKERFFDKQDQKRLDEDWLTGFDNRDRLASLAEQIQALSEELKPAKAALSAAGDVVGRLQDQMRTLERFQELQFEDIDLPEAQGQLSELRTQLATLTLPDSDLTMVKAALDEAEALQKEQELQLRQLVGRCAELKSQFDQAASATRKSYHGAEPGMNDAQRELAAIYFPTVNPEELGDILELERKHSRELRQQIQEISDKLQKQQVELAKRMSDALRVDTGALSEAGRELADIPKYLERLRVLTEEALPDKLKRFLEYLNRSSDDGVTQLLSYIDHQVSLIEERLDDLNGTMRRVDFQPGRYLRLVAGKVIHESVRTLERAQRQLNSARFADDEGESQYKALQELVGLLKDACERNRTHGASPPLTGLGWPRFRCLCAGACITRPSG